MRRTSGISDIDDANVLHWHSSDVDVLLELGAFGRGDEYAGALGLGEKDQVVEEKDLASVALLVLVGEQLALLDESPRCLKKALQTASTIWYDE